MGIHRIPLSRAEQSFSPSGSFPVRGSYQTIKRFTFSDGHGSSHFTGRPPGSCQLHHAAGAFRDQRFFWLKQLPRIQQRAHELMPTLHQLRASVELSREPSRARPHVPLLKELLAENGTGGSEWCDTFVTGFPILGVLGDSGVYSASNQPPPYISREELFDKATERFLSSKRTSDPDGRQLWFEAMEQVKKHWLDGTRRYNERGELIANDEPVLATQAFRFGVQQGPKLRAVDGLERSATKDATFVSTPVSLPSWGHVAQMCALFRLKNDRRPLAMAKADHADAYE